MKISAYMQVNQLYHASKAKKSTSEEKVKSDADKVELSSFGKELSVARQAVSESPEAREDRIADIKAAIQSGNYDLSMDRLADKLVDRYFG